MNSKRIWVLGMFLVLFVGAFFVLKGRLFDKSDEPTLTVMSPEFRTLSVSVTTTGVVEPQNRLEIVPSISGRIEEIFVSEGETVKKGQVLAMMSSSERAALIDAARSQGTNVEAYWQKAYKPIPLITPISGTVIVKTVEPGQSVNTSTPVLVISDRLIVKAQVDETDIGKVKEGQKAVVNLDAYPDIKVRSTVNHIAYESKLVSNVTIYEVDILPSYIPDVFRSGMSAEVAITVEEKDNVLAVPLVAVRYSHRVPVVRIKDPNSGEITETRVTTGLSAEGWIEIKTGLSDDDEFVVENGGVMFKPARNGKSNPLVPGGRRRRSR